MKRKTTEQRFWARVVKTTGCWLWTGSHTPTGYTCFAYNGKHHGHGHRFSYELHYGPVPAGKEIDHLCRNRGCVNPAHLEAVTHVENMRRGNTVNRINAQKTHCKRGHEFTPENTMQRPRGFRECLACRQMRTEAYKRGHHFGPHRYALEAA